MESKAMRIIRTILVAAFAAAVAACSTTPDYKVAALTADQIKSLADETAAKIETERAFMNAMVDSTKNAAKWNVAIETEIELLRSMQEFGDLALTERRGVPRLPLQDLLRDYNERQRTSKADAAKRIADAEKRLAATFTKIVFNRSLWDEAYDKTLLGAREVSASQRFNQMVARSIEAWGLAQEEAADKVDPKPEGAPGS
jgi:hypothetical protein